MSKQIDALLQERAGYVKRNLPKRVESVDAALRQLGSDYKYVPEVEVASVEPEVEKAVSKRGKKKKA